MNLLGFNDLVQRFASQARAATSTALDFTIGSVFRALAEANAALGIWLQWLVLIVLRQTRLATSQGSEVDTFVGDFGVTRLPAIGSTGQITLSRNSSSISALVPIGAVVKSIDGTQSFAVTLDVSHLAYNATLGGYTIGAGTSSITVPAQALNSGAASNVAGGTITVLATAIAGVDTVTNVLAFTGGVDAETDAALRARFALYISSLSKATLTAIGYAITSYQQGLTYAITENVDTTGATRLSNFVVTVDDGSGSPSTILKNSLYTAVDAVRPVGSTFSVRGPSVTTVAVSMTITAAPGYAKANLQGPVALAVAAYLNGLGIGNSLLYGQVYRIAYDAVPGVGTVIGLTLNGGVADISVGVAGVIKAGTVAVN